MRPSIFRSVVSGVRGAVSGVYQAAKDKVASTARSAVIGTAGFVGRTLFDAAKNAAKETAHKAAEEIGSSAKFVCTQLGKKAVQSFGSSATGSVDALTHAAIHVESAFQNAMRSSESKIRKMAVEHGTGLSGLGIQLAENLLKTLKQHGEHYFSQSTYCVDAFGKSVLDTINSETPQLQRALSNSMINFIMKPIMDFLKGFFNVLFEEFSSNAETTLRGEEPSLPVNEDDFQSVVSDEEERELDEVESPRMGG